MKRKFSTATALATAAAAAGAFLAYGSGTATAGFLDKQFTYAVKYICDVPQGVTGLPSKYATLINIHNPNDRSVDFCIKGVDAPGPNEATGEAFEIGQLTFRSTEADGGFALGCAAIADLPPPPFSPTTQHSDGFVVIISPKELDVVAAYTVRDDPSGETADFTASVDVEYIKPTTRISRTPVTCTID
jgi:hypothetical protein